MSFNKYFGETETGLSDGLIQALNTIPISAIPYISNMNQYVNNTATIGAGIFSANDGSAAAPSFTFKTDPDTGIYSGGANTVATTTNGTVRTIVSDSTTQLNNILECHNDLRIGAGPYVMSSKFDGSGNYFTGNVAIGSTSVGTDALDVTGSIKTTGRILPGTLNNTLSGVDSGSAITTGEYNILNGFEAGKTTITTGSNNILIGKTTTVNGASSTSNAIAIGENASAGAHGVSIGANVLAVAGKTVIGSETNTTATSLYGITTIRNSTDAASTTTGALIVSGGLGVSMKLYADQIYSTRLTPLTLDNILFGTSSGNNITTGSANICIGLNAKTTANNNTNVVAVGSNSIATDYSNSIGYYAGAGCTTATSQSTSRVLIGTAVGQTNTDLTDSVVIGSLSCSEINSTTGGNKHAIVGNGCAVANTTAIGLSLVGYQAGKTITTGNYNSCVGFQSGVALTTGYLNTFCGYRSGATSTTGYDNICIGNASNVAAAGTNNSIVIGASISGASNEIKIGNVSNTICDFANTGLTTFTGAVKTLNTTESISTTTGSLVVMGGVGIVKALRIGSTTETTSTSSGALIVLGGVGIAKALRIGSSTESTSITTGALIVTGGIGVSKNISTTSILFPAGGNTILNWYEESDQVAFDWTGIWATGQNGWIKFVRAGKIVTMEIAGVTATANTGAAISSPAAIIPAQFRPIDYTLYFPYTIKNNVNYETGVVQIYVNGLIQFKTAALGVYAGAGQSGFNSGMITYHVL